ncbi:flavohemoglobin expression-modulating QEGLA motif protein [Agrobacterium rubi]|uniref:flavohemoglobin expression-modulating QEGLA motif protein n=1 Tax=Agrobacterium rubi TaxID=28099 RepID=UPI001572067F|nr:flavohemoglobin expression-modulating QEGLA motif protein [Agrobacterium rubi]NTF10135.1 flavohemoglobin expression-modulating QEGLA motif protein [Agrobacterium rubi]NTF21687.1 flavohemoglobin expression-modulating QEGLA motif protein [Agrobacterium rubi]NTF28544.1 flavohemoglobin expression-modulating QEGLA motif protein [Agrobacterium rubi]
MSASPAKTVSHEPHGLDEVAALLEAGKAIRHDIGNHGRLHIDRPLPFICLHLINGSKDLAARDIAAANASYLIAANIAEAMPVLDMVGAEMAKHFGTFIVLDMGELEHDVLLADDSPFLPHYDVKVSATPEAETQNAKRVFIKAVCDADIRFRTPRITYPEAEHDPVLRLKSAGLRFPCIAVRFAPIYRQPESGADYPGLRETMIADLFDAGLRAFAAFSTTSETLKVTSHRALGRQAFVDAVRRADRSVDDIAASFDFLLSVTPINARKAFADFKASDFQYAPHFLYRPLSVDVEEQKRKLYSVAFDHLEDPVLYHLYREKQQEIDLQLSMLAHLHKLQFTDFSRALYGSVEPPLLALAETVLAQCLRPDHGEEIAMVDCYEVTKKAREMVKAYHNEDPEFDARVDIRDDLPPGLMVSGNKLLVSRHTVMEKRRLDALLHHEIGVHLLTYFNGSAQGLRLFRTGLSGYEGVQEGLAVLAEHLSGGMTRERLRLIAGRVVGCAAMLDGASFVDTYRIMTDAHGFDDAAAFNMVLRIYRGGGLSKDAIYLRGLNEILEHLRKGGALDPFWMGKISAAHFPIMQELALRGLLRPPAIRPAFLAPARATERLETIRSGLSIAEMATL